MCSWPLYLFTIFVHEVQRISLETCHSPPRLSRPMAWEALSPTGSITSVGRFTTPPCGAMSLHTAVWRDVADAFYVVGGYGGSSGP